MDIETQLLNSAKIQNITLTGFIIYNTYDTLKLHHTNKQFKNSVGFNIGTKHVKIFSSPTTIHSLLITGIQRQYEIDSVLEQLNGIVLSLDISLLNVKLVLSKSNIDLFEIAKRLKNDTETNNDLTIIYDNILHNSMRIKSIYYTIMIFQTGTTVISVKHVSWLDTCFDILIKIEKDYLVNQ